MKLSGKQLTTAVLIGLMGISAGGVAMAKPPIVQPTAVSTPSGGQQDPHSNPQGTQPPAGGQGTQTPATPNPVQDSNHIDFTGFLKLINQNSDDIKANKNSISALQDKVNQITGSGSTAPNLDKLQQDVKNLQDTVGADDNSGLKKDVKDIKTEVGDDNSGLKKDVKDIKTEVGDDNSGLKKDVKALQTTVGADDNSGLKKDVKALQTTVGADDNSGLKKDVKDIKTEVGDDNSGLKKDVKTLQDAVGADDTKGLKKELKDIQTAFGTVDTQGLKKDVNEIKNNYVKKGDLTQQLKELTDAKTAAINATSTVAGAIADVKKATNEFEAVAKSDAFKKADEINTTFNTIKQGIGDDNSGLKKDVKTLKDTVGDDNSGLKKDVKDIKTAVGDDNSGLKKDVKDIKTEVGDDNSGLKKDVKALQDTVGADDQHGLKKELKNIQTEFGSVNTDGLKKDVHENKVALAKKADTDKVNTALGLKADKSELADYVRKSDLKIGNNAKDIQKVGARAAALAGLHPLEFDPSTKLSFAVSSGSYDGENSVAFGAFYRPAKNVMFSAASTMGSKNAYTFGMSFKFGKSSATTTTNTPDVQELYRVVGQLQYQVAAQQQEIQQLRQAAQKTK